MTFHGEVHEWILSGTRDQPCTQLLMQYCLTKVPPWINTTPSLNQSQSTVKAGFHWRRSRSRSRGHKSASDLVKIENRSWKRSHKLNEIGVGRTRMVPFSSNSAYDAYDPMKTRLFESQAEVQGLFFGFHLWLRQPSFHWLISVGVISRIGRKWNCSNSRLMTPIFEFH